MTALKPRPATIGRIGSSSCHYEDRNIDPQANPVTVSKELKSLEQKCANAGAGLESDPTFPQQYLNISTRNGTCDQCKNFEIGITQFSSEVKEDYETWRPRKPPLYFSGCPTCRLLWQFRSEPFTARSKWGAEGPDLTLRRFNTAALFYKRDAAFYHSIDSVASLYVESTRFDNSLWRKSASEREEFQARPKGWLTPVENPDDTSAQPYSARTPKDGVDFKLVRSWIDACSESGKQCHISNSEVPKFPIRIINCLNQHVEWLHNGSPYLALSYTWGKHKRVQFEGKNSLGEYGLGELPDELPTLISDSIRATLALGYQFLWIDSYCIKQYDPKDVDQQISQMHLIYSLAEATIIAACCSDPSEPLAGVRPGTRHVPQLVELGGRKYLPISYPRIEEARWNTRGWTYQEAVLSRRRLVFFDEQVYYQCHCMMQLETLRMPLRNPTKTRHSHPGYFFPSMLTHESPRDHVIKHINAYISRDMKYGEDFLRGFMGVLQWFSQKYENSAHVTGLLLLRDMHFSKTSTSSNIFEKFAVSLAWHAELPGARRSGFPSWSWMGWYLKGTLVRYVTHFARCEALRNSRLDIEIEDQNGETMGLHRYLNLYRMFNRSDFKGEKSLGLTEHIPTLIVTAPMLQLRIKVYTNYSGHGEGRRSIVDVAKVGTMYAVVSLTSNEPWQGRMFTGLVLGAREGLDEVVLLLLKEVGNGDMKRMERGGLAILGIDQRNVKKCEDVSNMNVQTVRLV